MKLKTKGPYPWYTLSANPPTVFYIPIEKLPGKLTNSILPSDESCYGAIDLSLELEFFHISFAPPIKLLIFKAKIF